MGSSEPTINARTCARSSSARPEGDDRSPEVRTECIRRAEMSQASGDPDERCLSEILGRRRVPRHEERQACRFREVSRVEVLQAPRSGFGVLDDPAAIHPIHQPRPLPHLIIETQGGVPHHGPGRNLRPHRGDPTPRRKGRISRTLRSDLREHPSECLSFCSFAGGRRRILSTPLTSTFAAGSAHRLPTAHLPFGRLLDKMLTTIARYELSAVASSKSASVSASAGAAPSRSKISRTR